MYLPPVINLLSTLTFRSDFASSPAAKSAEERALHEAKLAKMEAEMKMVFQQKVQEKEAKLKQSEEELYARHREMKEALEKQRLELEDKKRKLESGRPLTPEKNVSSPSRVELLSLERLICQRFTNPFVQLCISRPRRRASSELERLPPVSTVFSMHHCHRRAHPHIYPIIQQATPPGSLDHISLLLSLHRLFPRILRTRLSIVIRFLFLLTHPTYPYPNNLTPFIPLSLTPNYLLLRTQFLTVLHVDVPFYSYPLSLECYLFSGTLGLLDHLF